MDLIEQLAAGFGVALTAQNLAFAAGGALLGRCAAALPGFSPVVMLALLLPIVREMDTAPSLILLTGLVAGTQNRSGSAPQPVALIAAFVGVAVVALLVPPLAGFGNRLGPADGVALVLLVMVGAAVLASESVLRGLAMLLFGLLLAQVGTDPVGGMARYSFGVADLSEGVPFLAVAVGLYAICPAITHLARSSPLSELPAAHEATVASSRWPRWTRWQRWQHSLPAFLRQKGHPSARQFGARAALIPLLSVGLPFNAPLALLFGAMVSKGIQPGPELATAKPELLFGLIASLWIGCVMLLVLSLRPVRLPALLIGLSQCSARHGVAAVVVLASVGLYTLGGGVFVLCLGAGFGVVGAVLHRLGCPPTPLLLGFLLEPLLQTNLRRALLLSSGDWATFVTRPLASGLLIAAALLVGLALLPPVRRRRRSRSG